MPDNDFWIGQEQIPVDLTLLLTYSNDEDYWYAPGEYALRVYTVDTLNTNFARPCFALGERTSDPEMEDVHGAIENTLHELLATDAYDTPLIAGIKPDGTGNYGEREVETNMVLSVYSRQNFIRYFALLRDMDAFVFVSGRKIEALEDLSGLPLAGNCSGLDIDRILQRPKCLG